MGFILKILFHFFLYTGVLCADRIRTLNCIFSDQESFRGVDGKPDVRVIHKDVILQFGNKGEARVNPNAITFLLTGTNLDLSSYLEDKSAEQLACELHRYSTDGVHVQWPLQENQDYNYWYNCIIKHRAFTVSSFLKQPSQNTAPGHHDYHHWTVIKNGDILTTTVALIMKTTTPQVKAALKSQTKLDCQFVVDHEGADYTVEWFSNVDRQKKQFFSYNSRSKLTEGTGVDLKALQKGHAAFDLPATNRSSQRTYICSVSLNPIVASLNIDWTTEEKPRVSLDVPTVLSVEMYEKKRIFCRAEHYYPKNVEINWYQNKPKALDQSDPVVLEETYLSPKDHNNGTQSSSAFIVLRPTLKESGTQYTCNVSHQSLLSPATVSFIIHVQDPTGELYKFIFLFSSIIMPVLLYVGYKLRRPLRGRARRWQSRLLPY